MSGSDAPDYLRYVAWSEFGRGGRVMRWRVADMPLRVHLPVPPADMFPDPEAIWEVVRDGVVDWTDVAAPGVPSFEFVDDPGDADIPIVWAPVTQGWWVAFARYNVSSSSLVFGVDQVLVAARYEDGTLAQLDDLYMTMLHEIGHALGLAGHSPYSRDVMYPKGRWEQRGLSERDRNTLQLLYSKPIGHRVAGARRD